MRKAVFFTHSNEEFADKYELRDWLAGTLRTDRKGLYRLREASGLGPLGRGSIVFFVKDDAVVGCAVVQKGVRDITARDRRRFDWNDKEDLKYKKVVKFFPDSIWPFSETQFLDRRGAARVSGKKDIRQGFPIIADDRILKLLARIGS